MKNTFFAMAIPCFLLNQALCQVQIKGYVTDEHNQPIAYATVVLKKQNAIGTVTDKNGIFQLTLSENPDLSDSLIISFVGYKRMSLAVKTLQTDRPQIFILSENETLLSEVVIKGQKPIAEEFSVTKVNKLDIYNNPTAAGDPLRAITLLPVSTNTSETANPNLRGSSSNRSAVILNGVPVSNPVRNSQINGTGNFSLFSPEIMDKMMIYGSNPPITYGDASAGLIEIETKSTLTGNSYQVSTALANLGFFSSVKLAKANFLQVYGNYQFPQAFIGLNRNSFMALKDFGSQDAGMNFRIQVNSKSFLNVYNYFIDEHYKVTANLYSLTDEAIGKRRRNFTIVNFNWQKKRNRFFVNSGTNFMNTKYEFGNLNTTNNGKEFFISINYSQIFNNRIHTQIGSSFKSSSVRFQGQEPLYYFAFSDSSPTKYQDTLLNNRNPEFYFYGKWYVKDNLILGSGFRKNIPISADRQSDFWSYQLNLKYDVSDQHGILIAGGQYNNYNIPTGQNRSFDLLTSRQLALEYKFSGKKNKLQLAAFLKSEDATTPRGELNEDNVTIKREINGLELFYEKELLTNLKISVANTFLNVIEKYGNLQWRGSNDMNFFLKAGLTYNNPSIITAGLSFIGRPGTYYTDIVLATYNQNAGAYEPVYSTSYNASRYGAYSIVNASLSKYVALKKHAIIAFGNVSNIFNKLNERSLEFNQDYSAQTSNYYQRRTIYIGMVFQINN